MFGVCFSVGVRGGLAAAIMGALSVSSVTAAAEPLAGFYIGASLGASWLAKTNQSIFPPSSTDLSTPSNHFQQNWTAGPALVGAVGWGFAGAFRIEMEGAYRLNRSSDRNLLFSRPIPSNGMARSFSLFANLAYDWHLGLVTPYAGVGVGYVWNRWSRVGGSVMGGEGAYGVSIADTKGSFGYQAILGVSMPVTAVPGLSVGFEYRYIGTNQPSFSATLSGPSSRTSFDGLPATFNQNVLFLVRFSPDQARGARR